MFATRTHWKLHLNRITLCQQRLERQGVQIVNLSEANPPRCQFPHFDKDLLTPFLSPANLSYAPHPQGAIKARHAIAASYRKRKVAVDPETIFLTSSTSEAYSFLFRLLLDPGERVLIPKPGYPLFDYLADINDISLDPYPLRYDDPQWEINMDALKKAYRPQTKAIILVNPNNPTGSYLKKNELQKLIAFAKSKQLAIISDEVFAPYSFKNSPSPSPLPLLGGEEKGEGVQSLAETSEILTFTLSGISKTLGLPQMKLAWIIANGPAPLLKEAIERLEVISDSYLSVSTPIQNALPKWLSFEKRIQGAIQKRLNQNLAFLNRRLSHHSPCSLIKPEGGWYAILKIPAIKSEEDWVLEFLEKDHIYVQPGFFFDFPREAYMVLSLLLPSKIFENGVNRILSRIEKVTAKQ